MAAAKNTCNKGKGKTGGLSTAAVAAKRGASAAAAKAPTWTQAQREAQGDLRTLWKAAKKVGSLIYYKVAQTYAEGYKGLQKHRIKPCEVAAFVNISLRSYYRGRKLAESRYLMALAKKNMLIWEMVDAWDADWRDLVVRKGGAVVEKETRFMTQGRRNLERLGITPEELTEEDDKLIKDMQLGHIKWDKRGKPILPKGWKVVTADGLPKDQGWITAQGEKILVETGLGGEGAKDRLEFKDLWAMHTEGTATILYLLRENTIKGFIVVGTLPITGTLLDIPHIWVYAVDNETRGRGAGAYLLHQALRLPNVVKAAFVSAHVYRANATSRAALEKAAKGADRRNVCIGHVSLEASSQDITWDSRGEAVEERDDNKLRQLILQRKGKNIWQHKPQPTTKPKPKKTPKKRGRKGKKPLMGAALRSQSQRAAAGAGHKQKTGTKTR